MTSTAHCIEHLTRPVPSVEAITLCGSHRQGTSEISCYHRDPDLAPSVPRVGGPGRVVDFSDPLALDSARIKTALAEHATAPLVIVEGTFALALPKLTAVATLTVYVDTPADIRVVRKTLR
ncbi:hypothetical protein ACFWHQ_14405 [Streptomyces sp. NPDC060334]|uniref:hypothetical protein n=1 Tax=unclassified Streptomyces TaxID=2593676 RepID=UPI0036625ECD